jgi:TRAP-type C4-dicarboxylate transport system permease small subunit
MLSHVDRIEEYMGGLLLVALGTLLTAQILLRYLFGLGWGWMEELARVGFIWVIYLGAIVGMRRHLHIRVTLGLALFPPRARPWVEALGDLILLAFCFAITWHGVELAWSTVDVDFRLSHTGMSMFWPYLVVPISFALQALRIMLRHARGRPEPESV